MKRLLCYLTACAVVCAASLSVRAEGIGNSARAYELYCADNDAVLLSDNADEKLPMASTTKIMTALITLEEASADDRVVTFTEDMIAEGSSMYLQVGEQVTLRDLAIGMLMQSGNDAANAAAIDIAGSVEAFADMMNAKAKAIGMENTHFVTPSGLDDNDHYSTAHDMALLMSYALKNDDFAEITMQTSMAVDFTEPPGKRVSYPNHNRLLRMYDGCVGGKTGYTDAAGRCLVSAARRDGMTLIAVTLDAPDDWNDHIRMFDYGFDKYTAGFAEIPDVLKVVGGVSDTVALSADNNTFIVPKDRAEDVKIRIFLPAFVYAPVSEGAIAGKYTCMLDGKESGNITVSFAESVAADRQIRSFISYIKDLFNWHS